MEHRIRASRVVGVFPHPDDEAYAAAGLLSLCARDGARVTLVCATRGEGGAAVDGATGQGSLPAVRTAELERSCRAIGAGAPLFLDLPDGGIDARSPEAVDRLVEILETEQPDLIVTLGPDGAYGHRDHLACTELVLEAIERLPYRVRVLGAAFPKPIFRPVWHALRRLPFVNLDPGLSASDLGIDPDEADLRLDVRAVRASKLAAIGAHRSQLPGGDPMQFLRPNLVAPLLDEELYVVLAEGPVPAP